MIAAEMQRAVALPTLEAQVAARAAQAVRLFANKVDLILSLTVVLSPSPLHLPLP